MQLHAALARYLLRTLLAVLAVCAVHICVAAEDFPSDEQLAAGLGTAYLSSMLSINPCLTPAEFEASEDLQGEFDRARSAWPDGLCEDKTLSRLVRQFLYLEKSILAMTSDPLGFISFIEKEQAAIHECPEHRCVLSLLRRDIAALRNQWQSLQSRETPLSDFVRIAKSPPPRAVARAITAMNELAIRYIFPEKE